ncbi:hypothetical protein C8R45DRAFT_379675 [Mycena sanguinolenta]|nr:hypothetical protein C8R45DRAFT_379675 [Mycena sanguinolenta]
MGTGIRLRSGCAWPGVDWRGWGAAEAALYAQRTGGGDDARLESPHLMCARRGRERDAAVVAVSRAGADMCAGGRTRRLVSWRVEVTVLGCQDEHAAPAPLRRSQARRIGSRRRMRPAQGETGQTPRCVAESRVGAGRLRRGARVASWSRTASFSGVEWTRRSSGRTDPWASDRRIAIRECGLAERAQRCFFPVDCALCGRAAGNDALCTRWAVLLRWWSRPRVAGLCWWRGSDHHTMRRPSLLDCVLLVDEVLPVPRDRTSASAVVGCGCVRCSYAGTGACGAGDAACV